MNTMLKLDIANCFASRVGSHGLPDDSLRPESPNGKRAADLTRRLAKTRGTGWERWRELPFNPLRTDHVKPIQHWVKANKERFDNMIVLGIGGSALGNIALQSALNLHTWNLLPKDKRNGPRMFVVDNVDPVYFGSVLQLVLADDPKLERTLFNVVSKSGETAETAAQFMTIRQLLIDRLGEKQHAKHIVAITDPAKGTMRKICDQNGYTTFPVPDGVGGRFSVLSPVGLFSAAMCGIDIEALLDGAGEMDAKCTNESIDKNPAAQLATVLVELGARGKTNHVMMPYANQLYLMADWFRQLWAESLGKQYAADGKREVFAGFTPIKALGTTDQHSQVQLYREGPNDKVFGFLEVEQFTDGRGAPAADLEIPRGLGVDALAYLEGASFHTLLNAEKRATEYAFIESQRPNFTIRFPKTDARHIGQFIALWEVVTAYAGLMLGIDAYDQPAVETGKLATFGLMGRQGYDEWKERVESALGQAKREPCCH